MKKQKLDNVDFDASKVEHLSGVFFHTIGNAAISMIESKDRHQERVIEKLSTQLRFFEQLMPPCLADTEYELAHLYCDECYVPLSCMDYRNGRVLKNCSYHETAVSCLDCNAKCCSDHIKMCQVDYREFCVECFNEHVNICSDCSQ